MGNSKLANQCHIHSGEAPHSATGLTENGVLAQVPGNIVAAALNSLPPPTAIGPDTAAVIFDAEHLGLVQFTIEKRRVKHGRHSHYYWSASRAEPVEPNSNGES